MTREEEGQMQQKGNVLVVGIKLDVSGRELLTWTLAKFTDAGDHIIALHVAASMSEADSLRHELDTASLQTEGVFDSIIGIYESFCSIKQVDLEVRVTHGPSLRIALIEEAKRTNAVRLILGYASHKYNFRSSFSLAKHCSRRLPSTCCVTVMQRGQVAFKREGALTNLVDSSRVLNNIQKTLRNHSRKSLSLHRIDGRRVSVESESSELLELAHGEYGNAVCYSSLNSRCIDSPVSVLHAYKDTSPRMQSSKFLSGDSESPSSSLSSPTDLLTLQGQAAAIEIFGPDILRTYQRKMGSSHSTSLGECLAQSRGEQPHTLPEHGPCKEDSALLGQQENVENCTEQLHTLHEHIPCKEDSALSGQEKCTLHVPSIELTDRGATRGDDEEGDTGPSVGWPLLRRSLPVILKQSSNRIDKMSVVEWALQLPDRPKEILDRPVDIPGKDVPCFTPLVRSESRLCSDKHEENNAKVSDSANDIHLECDTNTLSSKLAKLSLKSPCKQFHFVELQAATGNFNSDNMVGKGGCSKVYQGVLSDGRFVAVKCLKASALDSEDEFISEVEIMCTLCHYHIVQLMGYCIDSQHYMLVYNFAPEGNLEQKLHGGKGKAALPWGSRSNIAVGVAKALMYLHDGCSRPVIHRDVKSSNILLTSNLEPQLTDFGLAKWVPATCRQMTCSDVVGTFGYLAPEYFMFGKVSEKTDVYSFGVVLLELITGRCPIDNTKPKGEKNLVVWARSLLEDESMAGQLIDPKLEGAYNLGQLKNMMIAAALCLRQSPHTRPRMSRILKLLTGEVEDHEHIHRQDLVCKESDDGCDMPNYEEVDIRTHLAMALFGLDDDVASQASIDHSVDFAHSNKYLEEYLGGRYSRSSSFD